MNNLLLDIGNSDVKAGIGKPQGPNVKLVKRFSYEKKEFNKYFIKNLKQVFENNIFDTIGICVMSKEIKFFLKSYFKKIFKLTPLFINRNLKLPIKIKYSPGIGNDRICSAAAAFRLFDKENILIIDYGTATTFTMLSKGTLVGGMISPGIQTSLNSLTEKTSLPYINLVFPKKIINDNTIDNIKAGVLYQSLFSTERIILELNRQYKKLFVVATGGYSELIFTKTKLINTVDKNLVLKGINIILNENSN